MLVEQVVFPAPTPWAHDRSSEAVPCLGLLSFPPNGALCRLVTISITMRSRRSDRHPLQSTA
eukprot:8879634-Alexandrium_andersonii.AAC.1